MIGGGAGAFFIGGRGTDGTGGSGTDATSISASGDDVNTPGVLDERVLGNPDAPNTIVEYSSLTCPHCATFHRETLPGLKEKYIDTGKAKLVMREFPLDKAAWAGAVVARCLDEAKYFAFLDVLFLQQDKWAFTQDPIGGLFNFARSAGMTKEQFDACVSDEDLGGKVLDVRKRGAENFNVESTPTFFVNGKILRGAQPLEEFEKMMNL